MKNQDLQLVNFEQAERLDKAGFDWDTLSRYDYSCRMITETNTPRNHNDKNKWTNKDKQGCSAPTVALALKWMRYVKGIDWQIVWVEIEGVAYAGEIKPLGAEGMVTRVCLESTYEQAESALLDELLNMIDK